MRNMATNGSGVQSVSRAIDVLEELSRSRAELGVTELGRRLGVHKATASRLLATLAERGLVERSPVNDRYRLGFGLVRLAAVVTSRLDVVQQARLVLEGLAEQTNETVNLAVLDGDQVVHLDQISSAGSVVTANWVGRRAPLHATSNGKVLLAHLPDRLQKRLLRRRLESLTPNTVTDVDLLQAQLLEARVRGFAYAIEELEIGLNAVAAPVRDATGAVVAAVSVSAPAYRLTHARIPELGRTAREAGVEISLRLGCAENAADRTTAKS
jgi:DNA-binding IclR family transcriptional regulator